MGRKSWDAYFLDLALEASQMSTCPRAQVGAVVVNYNHPLATGFNGAPKKEKHCTEVGCLLIDDHCIRTVHAETNAISIIGLEKTQGATLYVTHAPCWQCAGLIINAGIVRIVYAQDYGNEAGPERLRKAGIK